MEDTESAVIAVAARKTGRTENDERCSLPLHEQLEVEEITQDEYRGKNIWQFPFMQGPYGGLLMAQALLTAHSSVTRVHPTFLLQSYHCYFIKALKMSLEVVYKVECTSIQSRMCTVLVSAVQNSQVCFRCLALFEKPAPVSHKLDICTQGMPNVPKPQDLVEEARSLDYNSCKNLLQVVCMFIREKSGAFDVYECTTKTPGSSGKAQALCWSKMKASKAPPTTSGHHQNLDRISIVYGSDFAISLVASDLPQVRIHGVYSVDHSMWFYDQVKGADWYLYCNELEHSFGGRTFNSARIYSESGDLVAICKQQSVLKSKI